MRGRTEGARPSGLRLDVEVRESEVGLPAVRWGLAYVMIGHGIDDEGRADRGGRIGLRVRTLRRALGSDRGTR